MRSLNAVQEQRLNQYFIDVDWSNPSPYDQRYYDFIVSIIEDDGSIDESLVNDYEYRLMG